MKTKDFVRQLLLAFAAFTLRTSHALIPAAASADDMPPLSAYGESPGIEDAALSPSGDRIAALMTAGERPLLVAFVDEHNPAH